MSFQNVTELHTLTWLVISICGSLDMNLARGARQFDLVNMYDLNYIYED